jgi:dTMP kinase
MPDEKRTRRGRFVTFEGPEGSGKSTQTQRLAARLKAAGIEPVVTHEPGGTPAGEAVRRLLQHEDAGERLCPEAEMLLFEASRIQLVQRVIAPALAQGRWVLCDRFADSTTAYQAYGRGLNLAVVLRMNEYAMQGCVPDLTFVLDLEVRAGFERLQQRAAARPDRFEREAVAFHQRVRMGYLELSRQWPGRVRVVDASQPADAVESEVWRIVQDVPRPRT